MNQDRATADYNGIASNTEQRGGVKNHARISVLDCCSVC